MARKLEVWGWTDFMNFPEADTVRGQSQQVRFVVATPSFAAAQRAGDALGRKPSKDYACTTGNDAEVEAAMSDPGQVFAATTPHGREYKPVEITPGTYYQLRFKS